MNVKEFLDVLAPETRVQFGNSKVYRCCEFPYCKIKDFLDCIVSGVDTCDGVLRVKVSKVNSVATTTSANRGAGKNAKIQEMGNIEVPCVSCDEFCTDTCLRG